MVTDLHNIPFAVLAQLLDKNTDTQWISKARHVIYSCTILHNDLLSFWKATIEQTVSGCYIDTQPLKTSIYVIYYEYFHPYPRLFPVLCPLPEPIPDPHIVAYDKCVWKMDRWTYMYVCVPLCVCIQCCPIVLVSKRTICWNDLHVDV